MPGFKTHLLAGAVTALVFQQHPPMALAVVLGSVFPDIDSRDSITNRSAVLGLGVLSMALLYNHGLLVSILSTLVIVCAFLLFLPKHRHWMHKIWGQALFCVLCFLPTFDIRVALAGIIGTTLHRLLDAV